MAYKESNLPGLGSVTPELPRHVEFAIFDEMLPATFSPFRTLEYSEYLEFFENAAIASLDGWHSLVSNGRLSDLRDRLPFPDHAKRRVYSLRDLDEASIRLGYITFLGNAFPLMPYLEERKIPFIFQLYPGGTFAPNDPSGDERLARVVKSPLCRRVIVTQTLTRDYLIDKIGYDPSKVEFIYGGVFDSSCDFDFYRDKKRIGEHKSTFDLCFVAHRYVDDLSVKGYVQFVDVARRLALADRRFRFHVVGGYTSSDIELGSLTDQFTFYGPQPTEFFSDFYPRMDVIVSLNKPAGGASGPFDGFPTGACIEAGFRGVLNCVTDPLNLNIGFQNETDILISDGDIDKTAERLLALFRGPEQLYLLAEKNCRAFRRTFDLAYQVKERLKVIVSELSSPEYLISRPSPAGSALDANVIDRELLELRNAARVAEANLTDFRARFDGLLSDHRTLADGFENLRQSYVKLEEHHRAVLGDYVNLQRAYTAAEAEHERLRTHCSSMERAQDESEARYNLLLTANAELSAELESCRRIAPSTISKLWSNLKGR